MSEDRLEPMDDLAALLEAERAAPAPTAVLESVWERLESGAGGAASPRPPNWLAAHALPVAVAAFVLGGAAGATLRARLAPRPPERIVPVYLPAPSTPSPVETSAPAPVAEPPVVPAPPPIPASPHASPPAPAAPSSLLAERQLLDRARAALTAHEPDRALSILSDHARRFARPQLGEEREALVIQALANAGRYDEARDRGARFRASQPNSLFLPAVDATLGSIP